jgi:L-alanine-DL-glutamate epimerase-like enolase superfamily enzyme
MMDGATRAIRAASQSRRKTFEDGRSLSLRQIDSIEKMSLSRRTFLMTPAALVAVPLSTDVRIDEMRFSYEEFLYRAPYKFGAAVVDRVTMLNVNCKVSNKAGKSAEGYGSMSMGNMWAFPAPGVSYDATLGAMKTLADRIAGITRGFREYSHPVEMNFQLEPAYLKAAAEVEITPKIPKLCTLVTASPFDAAIHDAYGKLHGRNAFNASGKDFMKQDLSRYLGKDFKGEYLDPYVLSKPTPRITMYHSVGASDPLVESDIQHKIGDGLPETLAEWIPYNGVRALKIKLAGNNLQADVERVVKIDRVTTHTQKKRDLKEWVYSLDFNENCPNIGFLLEFIRKLKEQAPEGFQRIQYIEQPTKRDLEKDRQNVMFEAAKLVPVVIDESLTGLDALLLAREMGYSGATLKACKGQSQSLLIAAAVQKYKMFRCVQDLTCPGAAFIHSAGLACHVPGVAAMEANAREYVPVANEKWKDKFPGLFQVKDGYLDTSSLGGPGLCAV